MAVGDWGYTRCTEVLPYADLEAGVRVEKVTTSTDIAQWYAATQESCASILSTVVVLPFQLRPVGHTRRVLSTPLQPSG